MGWSNQAFQLLIISASGGFTGEFVYSPGPGLGNLIYSNTASAGTDPTGNTFLRGSTTYSNLGGAGVVAGQVLGGVTNWYQAPSPGGAYGGAFATSGATWGGTAATSQLTVGQAGGTLNLGSPGQQPQTIKMLLNTGGQVVVGAGSATPATAALVEVQGTTALKNATAPASVAGYAEPFATGGNLAVVSGNDSNTYDTEVLHLRVSPGQTINTGTFPNAVTGATVPVGIGHYTFRCVINCTTAAGAGAPQFEFTFPSATGVMIQTYTPSSTAGNAQSNQNSFAAATSLSLAVGPTLNTHGFICVWEGDLTTTAAGNLALGAITSIVGDPYVVSTVWLDLYPVN